MIDPDIQLIDERIAFARTQDRAVGTVTARDTTGPGAMATILPGPTPIPVKVAGGVAAGPGDRVMLTRYGTDWVVTASYSSGQLGEANRALESLPGTTGALSSASFVDLSEFGSFAFFKAFDATYVRVQVQAGAFAAGSSGQAARVFWAVRLVPVAGAAGFSATDYPVGGIVLSVLAKHETYTSMRRLTGIPAGTYTVSLRWRRVSGAASVQADATDSVAVELDERVRSSVPIL